MPPRSISQGGTAAALSEIAESTPATKVTLNRTIPPIAFRKLVEGPTTFLVSCDDQGVVTYISPAFATFLGITIGAGLHEVLASQDSRTTAESLTNAILSQDEFDGKFMLSCQTTLLPRQFHLKTITRVRSRSKHKWMLFNDIHEQQRVQAQLTHAQRLEPVGIMASGIAHDVNNQLTAVLGQLNVGKHLSQPTGQALECFEAAEQATMRAAEMAQRLLKYVRKKDSNQDWFNLTSFLEETMRLVHHVMPRTITTSLEHTLPQDCSFYGDSTSLQQVFLNLALNSRDALNKHGQFDIVVEDTALSCSSLPCNCKGERCLSIVVTDNGPGVPTHLREHIFTPFFTTKDEETGTGLGLSMAKRIITKHGGALTLDCSYTEGCRFRILLPYEDIK